MIPMEMEFVTNTKYLVAQTQMHVTTPPQQLMKMVHVITLLV